MSKNPLKPAPEMIRWSNNYDQFENDSNNRNVTKTSELARSMKKNGFIKSFPLTVVRGKNGKFIVKDGGHRLAAAKMLEIYFAYIVLEECEFSIAEINSTSRHWSIVDYVDCYVRQGNKHFVELKEFASSHKLPLSICASLLAGNQAKSHNTGKRIKEGTFVIKSREYALSVASIIKALRSVCKISNNTLFINALSKCVFVKEFDSARFVEKAVRCGASLVPQTSEDGYLSMIEDIYNNAARANTRVPLKFLANNATTERTPIKSR
jgi:hypothetical protein